LKRDRVEQIYLREEQFLKSQKIEQARVAYYHGKEAFCKALELLMRAREGYSMEPEFLGVLESKIRASFLELRSYSQWVTKIHSQDLESRRLALKPSILVADRKYQNVKSKEATHGLVLISELKKSVELYDLRSKTTLLFARDSLLKMTESYPNFLPAFLWLARIHFELEEVNTARLLLDTLERKDPEFRISRSLDKEMLSVDPLLLQVLPQGALELPPPDSRSRKEQESSKQVNELERTRIQRVPFAVVLGNTAMERPQSGLSRAQVIYEVPVEGGITRLMALFSAAGEKSIPIGPVRSLRPYLLEEIFAYDPLVIHCGASVGGYRALKDLGIDTVDQLQDFSPFWREKSKPSPHNLFTSLQKLEASAFARHKLPGDAMKVLKVSARGYPYEENQVKSVHLELSPSYVVSYHLNPSMGAFERRVNGIIQKDSYDDSPIMVQNLIIQRVEETMRDPSGLKRLKTIGEGRLSTFIKGKRIDGIWRKSSVEAATLYLDPKESEILFLPSLTWVHMVSPALPIRVDTWEQVPTKLSTLPSSR